VEVELEGVGDEEEVSVVGDGALSEAVSDDPAAASVLLDTSALASTSSALS
jgi:hypothetical protein